MSSSDGPSSSGFPCGLPIFKSAALDWSALRNLLFRRQTCQPPLKGRKDLAGPIGRAKLAKTELPRAPSKGRRHGIIPHGAHCRASDARDPPDRMLLGEQQGCYADIRDCPETADQ